MPDLFFRPTVLFDSTLHRNGEVRQWIVRSRDIGGWDCRVLAPGAFTVCGCDTRDVALTRIREWTTEIEVLRTDGWN